jgi:Lrp/AsnC family leucine-responsive transcriptional regulator
MIDAVDDIDITILQLLDENARIPNAEIARRVGLAPNAIFQRIRKLEAAGVVRGYSVAIDPHALGFGLMAFITIQTNEHARDHDTAALLAAIPEVREVHRVVGEDCFFVKVRVTGTTELATLLDEQIRRIPSVRATRTTIVLKTSKDADGPPLERLTPQR